MKQWTAVPPAVESRRTDAYRSDLRDVTPRRADVRRADLRQAEVRRAEVRRAEVRQVDPRRADLRRADARRAESGDGEQWRVDWAEAGATTQLLGSVPTPQPPTRPAWGEAAPGGRARTGAAGAHPGTRRAAREREKSLRVDKSSGKGVAVATTRAVVLLGLVAGGYTEVAGAGPVANAEEPTRNSTAADELGPLPDFEREPQVNEALLLRGSERINRDRIRAAQLAAKKKADAKKRAEAEAKARAAAIAKAIAEANRNPKAVAKLLVAERGWSSSQFSCLDKLWTKESGWNYKAENPSSGAYGIPQALPGSKMSTIAPDWRTNATTQIKWGLAYIADRYGSPCDAWAHSVAHNWY